jgi:hypothetical protein
VPNLTERTLLIDRRSIIEGCDSNDALEWGSTSCYSNTAFIALRNELNMHITMVQISVTDEPGEVLQLY